MEVLFEHQYLQGSFILKHIELEGYFQRQFSVVVFVLDTLTGIIVMQP